MTDTVTGFVRVRAGRYVRGEWTLIRQGKIWRLERANDTASPYLSETKREAVSRADAYDRTDRRLRIKRPAPRHDWEPGEGTHPMKTDPSCRVCGEPRRSPGHV
jgi:hypothetical protein